MWQKVTTLQQLSAQKKARASLLLSRKIVHTANNIHVCRKKKTKLYTISNMLNWNGYISRHFQEQFEWVWRQPSYRSTHVCMKTPLWLWTVQHILVYSVLNCTNIKTAVWVVVRTFSWLVLHSQYNDCSVRVALNNSIFDLSGVHYFCKYIARYIAEDKNIKQMSK